MAIELKWKGKQLIEFTKEAMLAGVTAAAAEHQIISLKKVSIQNTPVVVPIEEAREAAGAQLKGGSPGLIRVANAWYWWEEEGQNKTQITVYPFPSKPGESVRRRTGFGQKNIVRGSDAKDISARVGYTRNARYMTEHELGIMFPSGFQKRPTLVPALMDNLDRLAAIAVRAAKKVRAQGGRGR